MNKKVFRLSFQTRTGREMVMEIETSVRKDGTTGGKMIKSLLCDRFLETNCVQRFNSIMDIVESTVLVHACQGVDVTSKGYVEGVRCAYEAACARCF